MVQTATKYYSFEEYLTYQDDTDLKYELVNGELIPIPLASGIHALILTFLLKKLITEIDILGLKWLVMPGNIGIRTAKNKARIPDLVILTETQKEELKNLNSAVLESAPLLAVEIVSPGNPEDDYRYKRSEYAVREIPEYGIIDPNVKKISVLILVNGFYEVTELRGDEYLTSQLFPELNITVNQILNQ